jgi:hypothetical protein
MFMASTSAMAQDRSMIKVRIISTIRVTGDCEGYA